MVKFESLYTYDRPRNKTSLLIDTILKIVIIGGIALVAMWVASRVLLVGEFLGINTEALVIANPQTFNPNSTNVNDPVPVYFAYIGLLVGFLGGIAMYLVPMIGNLLLQPPGGKARTLVVKDDQYADTTYECGEAPIGSGQAQINLQYYSFALVFIMFDIITALTLMFAIVFSFGAGTTGAITFGSLTYTPTVDDVLIQVGAVLFFILSPLLVLGLWLRKKAILWQ